MAQAQHAESEVVRLLRKRLSCGNNWMPFEEFMQTALHEPGLGYYSAGAPPLGAAGDFVTAPELGSLFAKSIAKFAAPLLKLGGELLELGGGSGALACDLARELEKLGCLPERHLLLETSAPLAEMQQKKLRSAPGRFAWPTRLPDTFRGLVLANEVLDTLPCKVLARREAGWVQQGVSAGADGALQWADGPPAEAADAHRLERRGLPVGSRTEINRRAEALVATLAGMLSRGAMLFIDYGFPAAEYYHPQRSGGTLMAHRAHTSSTNVLADPGRCDITAHIDFSAIAAAAEQAGASVLGYANQEAFLLDCGIADLALRPASKNAADLARQAVEMRTLLMPHEMGELYKVLALGKGNLPALAGFGKRDRTTELRR